jgi:predicted nucleotidyltransferase
MPNSSALDLRKPPAARTSDLPARFRERVLAALPGQVERIVLFGSRARAEAQGDSDWDFAVFLAHQPAEEDQRRIGEIGRDLWRPFDTEVQTLVFESSRCWPRTSSRATFVTMG